MFAIEVEHLSDMACDECHKVYNPQRGDRFWYDVDGVDHDLVCEGCRRDLDAEYAGEHATV